MSPEVQTNFKDSGTWNCRKADDTCTRTKPCNSCRGARNRRSGMRKQREARKSLERVSGTFAARFVGQLGNEEAWSGLPVRVEVKSGAVAKPVDTKCRLSEAQADANRAIGDIRPFVAVFMPAGTTDGWCCIRLSQLSAVIEALGE